ncbi:hypothetical protein STCU_11409 [Strigomonas culicis]|uniref:Uncharacterized protein n=1 Tax=Strigomonas culicis TaxID=28005 RepID=S9TE33_9TRYP|nr:hypothetical protein STCU_11409 [Strigomonas culicis]|eukprot:EPY16307.1 hypothetical protein STCU_11409 [Strigomonas culicis]
MAFGYEHRLDLSMMNRLRSFEEYATICSLIAALWCDASELLLRDDFVDGCQRIAALWEESRTMAELHSLLFGEVLRPRWQVQLDEMQRVITTTSAHDKAAASETGAAGFHSGSPSPVPPGTASAAGSPLGPPPTQGLDRPLPPTCRRARCRRCSTSVRPSTLSRPTARVGARRRAAGATPPRPTTTPAPPPPSAAPRRAPATATPHFAATRCSRGAS